MKKDEAIIRKLKRGRGEQRYVTLQAVLSPEYGARVRKYATENGYSVSALLEYALKQVVK